MCRAIAATKVPKSLIHEYIGPFSRVEYRDFGNIYIVGDYLSAISYETWETSHVANNCWL